MTRSYSSVTSYLIFIKARKVIRSSSVLFCFSFNYANVDPHFPFMVFISVMKFTHLVADTCKLTDVRVFNLHFFPLILKCGISLSNLIYHYFICGFYAGMFQHPRYVFNGVTLRDIDNYKDKKNCRLASNYFEGQKSPFDVFIPTENEFPK